MPGAPDPAGARPDPAATSGVVQGDSPYQSRMLAETAAAGNYRNWLVSLALPYVGDDPLEIGSGLGDYAEEFAALGHRFTVSEADPARLDRLRRRFAGSDLVTVEELAVPIDRTAQHSAVVAYNVLEHIPDDVGALRSFARLVRPGGRVIVFVPAFPFAFGELDRRVGHQRRYRLASMRATLAAAGLEVEVLHHVNAVGLLAWFVVMRLLRSEVKAGPALGFWDRVVIPGVRALERHRHPPFGQSILAVARTPGGGSPPGR